MRIHLVIQERRRHLGLTQEQVAEALGVTAPAVNKWEKGSTCPDITLLPPLARLLKIDLNTLFSFYEDLPQQELICFCRELREAVLSDGIDAGFSLAREKLREYPNSDQLLHTTALQLQGLLTTVRPDADRTEAYLNTIAEWFEKLTQSPDAILRNSANFMLASRAVSREQYEKAQAHLDRIPNRSDTPDKRMLQAAVYHRRGQPEEQQS